MQEKNNPPGEIHKPDPIRFLQQADIAKTGGFGKTVSPV
jgi:hypothetical protein